MSGILSNDLTIFDRHGLDNDKDIFADFSSENSDLLKCRNSLPETSECRRRRLENFNIFEWNHLWKYITRRRKLQVVCIIQASEITLLRRWLVPTRSTWEMCFGHSNSHCQRVDSVSQLVNFQRLSKLILWVWVWLFDDCAKTLEMIYGAFINGVIRVTSIR